MNKQQGRLQEARKVLALKYCEWCPHDCQGLTEEEKLGCLACGGFADDVIKGNLRGSEGEHLIAALDKQIWPQNPYGNKWPDETRYHHGWNQCKADLRQEGWRKVILPEE